MQTGRALGGTMKRTTLWKIAVTTTPEAEEAVAELLAGAFGQPVASYTDVETRRTAVSVYVPKRPVWSRVAQAALASGLKRVAATGLDIGPGSISLKRIRPEDWAESWKRHFKPLAIGSALLLKPSWSRRRPRKGQAVVVLDPGLSFGTGRHPTTAFCLRQLVARRRAGEAQSFLDIGTGSGILAIAAARLGYAPVDAFDYDPQSIRVARANARRNGVSARIRFWRQDVTRLPCPAPKKYFLVCANLDSSPAFSGAEADSGSPGRGRRTGRGGHLEEGICPSRKSLHRRRASIEGGPNRKRMALRSIYPTVSGAPAARCWNIPTRFFEWTLLEIVL